MKKTVLIILSLLYFSINAQIRIDTTYRENGKDIKIIQKYKNGKKHGKSKYFYKNGHLAHLESYKNGKKHGKWKEFYKNGRLEVVYNYKNDKKHGRYKRYFENGAIKSKGKYRNGKKIGKHISYMKYKGKYVTSIIYKYQGDVEKRTIFYPDSKNKYEYKETKKEDLIRSTAFNHNGKISHDYQKDTNSDKPGTVTYYYKNGKASLIGHYRLGNRNGVVKRYHDNGQLYKSQVWENKKLLTIESCFDANGKPLDYGDFKQGNGEVREYDSSGKLINILNYKDGKPIDGRSVEDYWNTSYKLNYLAWKAYENEDDSQKLQFAIQWIEHAIEVQSRKFMLYAYIDTYAALLYKTGEYDKALIQAKKAIIEAKKEEENYKETALLIEKINKKLNSIKK